MPHTDTIAVAMSGGVDSSTVAAILAHSGETIVGLTLQLWDQTRLAGKHGIPDAPKAGRCCSLDDVYDARRVADHLDIPYYVVNQQERFEKDVVRPFVDEYLAGRTPIPCSLCNDHIKFDQLLKTARSIGADRSLPAITPSTSTIRPAAAGSSSVPRTGPRTRPTSFSDSRKSSWRIRSFLSAG